MHVKLKIHFFCMKVNNTIQVLRSFLSARELSLVFAETVQYWLHLQMEYVHLCSVKGVGLSLSGSLHLVLGIMILVSISS